MDKLEKLEIINQGNTKSGKWYAGNRLYSGTVNKIQPKAGKEQSGKALLINLLNIF
ncbi:hypothetical protein [Adhaeribacter aerolatus]|uniref:hypothetical protein n=1 Tax=Adhaeribacter aerolatus TaxID=670289 RepID=UPI0014786961|nr:hypothetical protein [Adhaeribacter aerolatus]